MKTLTSLIDGWLPKIDPETLVAKVASVKQNRLVPLAPGTKASEVRCPDCGCSEGYLNAPSNAWMCSSEHCFLKFKGFDERQDLFLNAPKPVTISQPLNRLAQFRAPKALECAEMASCDQSPSFKEEWLKWAVNPRGCLIFSGAAGTGKSFAACALLRSYGEKGSDGLFLSITDLFLEWKTQVLENRDVDLLLKIASKEMLVIDDIGQRTPTDAFMEFLYMLIDKRNNEGKGTIVTTNLTYNQMRERLGEAITSRLTFGKAFKFAGADRRVAFF